MPQIWFFEFLKFIVLFLLKYNALSLLSVLGKTNPEVWVSFLKQENIKSKHVLGQPVWVKRLS